MLSLKWRAFLPSAARGSGKQSIGQFPLPESCCFQPYPIISYDSGGEACIVCNLITTQSPPNALLGFANRFHITISPTPEGTQNSAILSINLHEPFGLKITSTVPHPAQIQNPECDDICIRLNASPITINMELDLTNHVSLEDFFSNDTKVLTFDVNFVTTKRGNDLIVPTMPIEVFVPSIQFAESISLDTVIVPYHQLSVQACLEAENIPENSRDYTIPVLLSMSNITDNSKHNETYQVLPFYFEQNTNQSCYTLERPTHNVNSAYTFSAFIENDLDANQFYRVGNRNNISIVWEKNDNYIVEPSTTILQQSTPSSYLPCHYQSGHNHHPAGHSSSYLPCNYQSGHNHHPAKHASSYLPCDYQSGHNHHPAGHSSSYLPCNYQSGHNHHPAGHSSSYLPCNYQSGHNHHPAGHSSSYLPCNYQSGHNHHPAMLF